MQQMDIHQYAFTGNTNAQQLLARQVNIFLFDLKNEASEHGFRSDDSWTLQLATDEEFADLKKHHYPIITLKLRPDVLLNAFQQVKGKLQQSLSTQEVELTVNDLIRDNIKQIAAFPAQKARK